MQKYEIMLIVDGRLNEQDANKIATEMSGLLKGARNLKETKNGLRTLAYEIQGTNQGYYYIYEFDLEDRTVLEEFRRIALITKGLLRHIIVNRFNNYGYRASINEKKIKRNQIAASRYEERKKHFERERELRQRVGYNEKTKEESDKTNVETQRGVKNE